MSSLDKGSLAHGMLERLDFAAEAAEQHTVCRLFARQSAGDQPADDIEEVITAVAAFAASPLGRELAGALLLREHPFTLRFTGKAVYYLKGAMDLVAVTAERVTVYDYKYLARKGADLEGYRFQLRTYMLALAKAWPEREIRGKLVFLRGNECEEVTCGFEAFHAELRGLMDAVRQRGAEAEFALRDGCDGSHCPFRQRCGTLREPQ
jgi:ATP-dependent exoDNAse (exonuclease V) beta subunit